MTDHQVSLVVAAVGVVAAVTFGILELKAESDYDKEVNPSADGRHRQARARTYAILTNVGIVTAAVGLVAAGIAGYPLVLKPSERPKTAFIFTPAATPEGAGGARDRPLLVRGPDPSPRGGGISRSLSRFGRAGVRASLAGGRATPQLRRCRSRGRRLGA